jgi:hypothetical protein
VAHRTVSPDRRQRLLAHRPRQRRVVPPGLGDHVVHGPVPGLCSPGLDPGGHRLDALALARQQQPGSSSPVQ